MSNLIERISARAQSSGVRVTWLLLLLTLFLVGCDQGQEATIPEPSAQASEPVSIELIEERVSELRGLETLEPVPLTYLTTEELRQQMTEEFEKDYSPQEARDDALLYAAFDLMDLDVDLFQLLIDLQTEQVLGFYDPDTQEMYVVKSGQEPGTLERWTFSHEYTHALQDQHFDLQALGFTNQGDEEKKDSEQQFAIRSLVEGDASLLMQQYALQYFDLSEMQAVLDESLAADSTVLDSAPRIVRESLLFPYEQGLTFVLALFKDGGWSAIDAAYGAPPVSTEQIIHPDRYPEDVPQLVSLPPLTDTLGSGWRLVDEDVMGEFGLRIYLDVYPPVSEGAPSPEAAADGWGGDRYAVYWREDETGFVLALRSVWDTAADADEFFQAYTGFATARFGGAPDRQTGGDRMLWFGDDALSLTRNDRDEILVLIAPGEATLDNVSALFPDF
jgi:hypothetical protein